MNPILWFVLIIVGTVLIFYGSEWLEGSSAKVSDNYDIPSVVKGSIITAFGSSFPELSSVVIASLIHGKFELGMSVVIGSAIFNIVFIPALSGLKSDGLDLSGKRVRNEMVIYFFVILSVGAFLISSLFIFNDNAGISELESEVYLSPYIAVSLLVLYAVYVTYQWRVSQSFENNESKVENINREWLLLAISLIIIGVGVEATVRAVIELGNIYNTPSLLWGVVVVAASSSLPDALVSIKQADKGEASASFANVAGSNTFDLLVVLSLGVIVSGGTMINLGTTLPLMGVLVLSSILMLYFTQNSGDLSTLESYILILYYGLFCLWILLEAINVTNII